jgi:SAP domain
MAKLVEICKSVSSDYRTGKLSAEFTYEGFMQRVRSIPIGTDFSRIAKDRSTIKAVKSWSHSGSEDEPSNGSPDFPVPEQKSTKVIKNDSELASRYNSWKVAQLKEECDRHGLPKTGNKVDLVKRLLGPRPPAAWLKRRNASLYVPSRYDTCASAILVAIWIHQRQNEESWKGLEKEDIISLSERLDISKDPFSGTGTGIFNYDGWSCMGQLREGQSPLVFRQKGGLFKLTTIGGDLSGFHIASAMHDWCHAYNKCRCNDVTLG